MRPYSIRAELGEMTVEPIENAHDAEAKAAADLEPDLLLGKGEVFLEDGDAEHEGRIEEGAAALSLRSRSSRASRRTPWKISKSMDGVELAGCAP